MLKAFSQSGNNNNSQNVSGWQSTTTEVKLIDSTKNVNIGNVTPTAKLDVNGDMRIRLLPELALDELDTTNGNGNGNGNGNATAIGNGNSGQSPGLLFKQVKYVVIDANGNLLKGPPIKEIGAGSNGPPFAYFTKVPNTSTKIRTEMWVGIKKDPAVEFDVFGRIQSSGTIRSGNTTNFLQLNGTNSQITSGSEKRGLAKTEKSGRQ